MIERSDVRSALPWDARVSSPADTLVLLFVTLAPYPKGFSVYGWLSCVKHFNLKLMTFLCLQVLPLKVCTTTRQVLSFDLRME